VPNPWIQKEANENKKGIPPVCETKYTVIIISKLNQTKGTKRCVTFRSSCFIILPWNVCWKPWPHGSTSGDSVVNLVVCTLTAVSQQEKELSGLAAHYQSEKVVLCFSLEVNFKLENTKSRWRIEKPLLYEEPHKHTHTHKYTTVTRCNCSDLWKCTIRDEWQLWIRLKKALWFFTVVVSCKREKKLWVFKTRKFD
jgi:hypothetical protein